MKTLPISQAEMTRQNAKLDRKYGVDAAEAVRERSETRYTMTDMAILTGWTQEYLFRLEKDKRIPRAQRVGTRRLHRWTEEQARLILGFKQSQESRFNGDGH